MTTTITAITPTRERYQAFERCIVQMDRQVRGPDQWVVVDDGKAKAARPPNCHYIDRPNDCKDGPISQCRNLLAGLRVATSEWITIFTDDDWYHPNHLLNMEMIAANRPGRLLLGQRDIRAWHAELKGFAFGPRGIPLIGASMIHSSLLPELEVMLMHHESMSKPHAMEAFWKKMDKKTRWTWDQNITHISITNMPGASSITKRDYHRDEDGLILREWIGDNDAAYYMEGISW